MKNLCLSSLFIAFLFGCSPTQGYKLSRVEIVTNTHVRAIINKDNSLLYKAKINLYNKYYGGLIVLKQIDPSTAHLVFVTELGMKMFDFEIKNNEFKLVYVFEPLNQPKILKILESDMKLILLQSLINKEARIYEKENECIYVVPNGNYKNYYFVNKTSKTVGKAIVKGNLFSKEKVNYIYNDSLNAQQIKLKHKGLIHLKIELNNISKEKQNE